MHANSRIYRIANVLLRLLQASVFLFDLLILYFLITEPPNSDEFPSLGQVILAFTGSILIIWILNLFIKLIKQYRSKGIFHHNFANKIGYIGGLTLIFSLVYFLTYFLTYLISFSDDSICKSCKNALIGIGATSSFFLIFLSTIFFILSHYSFRMNDIQTENNLTI